MGGPPPGPPPAPPGLPPELMMALMGGGAPPGLAGPGGPPPGLGPPPGPDSDAGAMSAGDHLREALKHIDAYRSQETDDEDLAAAAKMIAALQGLFAKQQKEKEAAMGTSPAIKGMRRMGGY